MVFNPSRRIQRKRKTEQNLDSEFGKSLLDAVKKYGSVKEASKQLGVAEDWFKYFDQESKAEKKK